MGSGLYDELVAKQLLVPHVEVDAPRGGAGAFRILKPDLVPFISYPYEWSFGQLKAAALTTLRIQRIALRHDMSAARRLRVQRAVRRLAARLHRHAFLRGLRRGKTVGGLPAVLPALPGAALPHGRLRPEALGAVGELDRRHPARRRPQARAPADTDGGRASSPTSPCTRRRRSGSGRRRPGDRAPPGSAAPPCSASSTACGRPSRGFPGIPGRRNGRTITRRPTTPTRRWS